MKTEAENLSRMIAIVAASFRDRLDKGGEPYILHCLKVMEGVKHLGYKAQQIAVAHDLLEDCSPLWDLAKLAKAEFSPDVLYGISTLTHNPTMPYDDYIKLIANAQLIDGKRVIQAVKMADLRHNSDISRLKGLRKKDFDRIEKYHRAYMYLKED